MGYTKQKWENLPSTNTPITAERLNHMEDGIEEAWEHGGGGGGGIDIGTIVPFSGAISQIPNGFMLCDGSAISRTTYATLFSIIGTTYGEGDGSTTFNLPNLQGKTLVGVDSEDTDFDTLGETGGEKTHTLLTSEMPSHNHNRIRVVAGNQFLGIAGGSYANVAGLNLNSGKYPYTDETNTNVETSNTGGGQSHNNLQPYITINYIIKVLNSQSGDIRSESLPVGTELDFDGDSQDIPTGWEQVDDVPIYSTDETISGTWIDGSEVYKKVVNMGNLANSSSKSVAHGIVGNFKLIGLNGGAISGTTNIWATGFNDEIYLAGDNVIWNTKADRRNFTGYIILEYIKVSSS